MSMRIVMTLIVGCLIGAGGILVASSLLTQVRPASSPRCIDAAIRFPETQDPQGAMAEALRQNGVQTSNAFSMMRPYSNGYIKMADELVAGWAGVSLLQENTGKERPTLAQYIVGWPNENASWPFARLNTISITSGNWFLVPTISRESWNSMGSWSPDSCEGAFLKDPRNSRLVRLMGSSVGQLPQQSATPTTALSQVDAATQTAIRSAVTEYSRLETNAFRRLDGSELSRRATGAALKRAQDEIAELRRQRVQYESEYVEDRFTAFRWAAIGRVEVDLVAVFNVRHLGPDGTIIRQIARAEYPQTLTVVQELGQWKLSEVRFHTQ